MDSSRSLRSVYDGWDGYHRSIAAAVAPLTPKQLAFRAARDMLSVGEIAWHIGDGRVQWFSRLNAPGCAELLKEVETRPSPDLLDSTILVDWLERTWTMIGATLDQWTVDDLDETYPQPYQGKVYAVSRQWTIWRIMAHDIHHGGQMSELLAMQGIIPLQLTVLGGHLTEPPLAD